MTKTQERKQAIRQFLRTEVWTEEKLCALLAHAESKLVYHSCCCLIGTATADHALQGKNYGFIGGEHYTKARQLPFALEAAGAYFHIGQWVIDADVTRRRILRPIIKAELRRRDSLKSAPVLESKPKGELAYASI